MTKNSEYGLRRRTGPVTESATFDGSFVAMEALIFFGAVPDEARRFFDWSGLEADGLRSSVADPGFALGILDYFAENLISLERFCTAAGLQPGNVLRLHEALKIRGLSSHDDL